MPDTQRTLAALLALFYDNTTGDISPQDMRDFVVTMEASHGQIGLTTAAATVIANNTNYFAVNGTTFFLETSPAAVKFDNPSGQRLRYTGVPTIFALVICTCSFTVSSNNQIMHFRLAKNGTTILGSEIRRKAATGGDVGAVSLVELVSLATNDYVELWARNETAANNMTAETLDLTALAQMQ